LAAPQPFALPAVIRSHGWYQLAPFRSAEPYATLDYVDELTNGRVVAWTVRPSSGGVTAVIDAALDEAEEEEVAAKLTWMLGLEQDLGAFYAAAAGEPKLAHVAASGHGRILRSPTLFEDTVKTILTTNTAWSGTKRMVNALVDLYGAQLADDPARRAFPTPARLAAVSADELREVAKLGYRAPHISELARRVNEGELDLEALQTSALPTAELRRELLALKGVGPYAAANLLMLLGRTDYIPVDSYARDVVSREFYDGAAVGEKEIEAAFAHWREWKGMAFWFWDYGNYET
jgi:3-methyladenine DNA glycosylase/8-oxoguanine DNA glycosylase